MNNWSGLRNSALIRAFGDANPAYRVLGRVVKHWARRRGIADRKRGRLSTYGLMLMLAQTFQRQGLLMEPEHVTALCDYLHKVGEDVVSLESVDVSMFGAKKYPEDLEETGRFFLEFLED